MPDAFSAAMQRPGNQFNAKIMGHLLMASLGAGGIAAALRGAKGLGDVYSGTQSDPPKMPIRRQFVTVPVQAQLPATRRKQADTSPLEQLATAMQMLKQADMLTNMGGRVLDAVGGLKAPDASNWGPGKETVFNYGAQTALEKPWVTAAAPLMLAGGIYAGHKLTDSVLDWSKKKETDSELEAAKKRYEQALLPKRAEAADPLDAVYDQLATPEFPVAAESGYKLAAALLDARVAEKQAGLPGVPLNVGLGTYGLLAGLTALGAGKATYNWARKHHEDKAVGDALKQRRERLFAQGPVPIMMTPEVQDYQPEFKAANIASTADTTLERFQQKQRQVAMQTAAMLGAKPQATAKQPEAAPPPLPSVGNRPH